MPVDLTSLFKARARLIGQKCKDVDEDSPLLDHANQSVPSSSYRQYSLQIGQLAKDMSDFSSVVLSKREEYLAFNSPFAVLTEEDRDKFDRDSEKALGQLNGLVSTLGARISNDTALKKSCERAHLSQAVAITQQQLSIIGNMITNMRKLRLRHMTNRKDFGKLASLTLKLVDRDRREQIQTTRTSPFEGMTIRHRHGGKVDPVKSEPSEGLDWNKDNAINDDNKYIPNRSESGSGTQAYVQDLDEKPSTNEVDDGLSDQERAQLVVENEKLYERCAQVDTDIDHLETQIAEIQRLQETFAEKLLDQERDIELVHETAVATTENLRDGNEWIREAISNSAGRRVVVLFCIIVITFTLLFLDWYNP